MFSHQVVISVEGNIGSGKSTFMTYLSELYETDPHNFNDKKIAFVQEPIEEWNTVRDENDEPMLKIFYGNQKRNAFSFQMMAYISRLVKIREALRSDVDIVIVERSLYTDREVFAKMLYEDGMIRKVDYEIYLRWFDEFAAEISPDYVFYLRASPEICLCRTLARARDGEGTIPLEYLVRCHTFHDNWLYGPIASQYSVHTLNADVNVSNEEGISTYVSWREQIVSFFP